VADGARPALDQDGLALDGAIGEHSPMSRAGRHSERGPLREADSIGERDGLPGRQRHQLRAGAVSPAVLAVVDPDPLADAPALDAFTHRLDHAGAVAVGNDARERHRRTAPAGPLLGVRRIDAGGVNSHQHLAACGLRRRHLADL
jgi:hypothetical protein